MGLHVGWVLDVSEELYGVVGLPWCRIVVVLRLVRE